MTEPRRGVYLLFTEKVLTYVGRSVSCDKRIATHRSNGRVFDFSIVAECSPETSVWVEAQLIARLAPKQNKALNADRFRDLVTTDKGPPRHDGVVGLFGHTLGAWVNGSRRPLHYQFEVTGRADDDGAGVPMYVCQLYSWASGGATEVMLWPLSFLQSEDVRLYVGIGRWLAISAAETAA